MLSVETIDESSLADWQAYVDSQDRAGPMHHAGWYRVMDEAFAVDLRYLMAKQDGRVAGILPLYVEGGFPFPRALVSLPGGALADDAQAEKALYEHALAVARNDAVAWLTIKDAEVTAPPPDAVGYAVKTVIDLSPGTDALWAQLSSNTRRKVRRAGKNGFHAAAMPDRLDAFYPIYARRMLDLGTPAPGAALMDAITRHLAGIVDFLGVTRGEALVGGMLAVRAPKLLTSQYVSIDRQALSGYAMYALYWAAIEHAAAQGFPAFDLGRSIPGSGNHAFKQMWGGSDVPVPATILRARASADLPAPVRTEGGTAARLWQRLPLPLANLLGPVLRRRLPFG